MLKALRCNPNVIGRNWRSLLTKRSPDLRIKGGRSIIDRKHTYSLQLQQFVQPTFIALALTTLRKAGAQFANCNNRQPKLRRRLQTFTCLPIVSNKIGKAVCIDEHSHTTPYRQSSGSIRRCSSSARRTSGSSGGPSARKERSRFLSLDNLATPRPRARASIAVASSDLFSAAARSRSARSNSSGIFSRLRVIWPILLIC
jgi:hypothetical protein